MEVFCEIKRHSHQTKHLTARKFSLFKMWPELSDFESWVQPLEEIWHLCNNRVIAPWGKVANWWSESWTNSFINPPALGSVDAHWWKAAKRWSESWTNSFIHLLDLQMHIGEREKMMKRARVEQIHLDPPAQYLLRSLHIWYLPVQKIFITTMNSPQSLSFQKLSEAGGSERKRAKHQIIQSCK